MTESINDDSGWSADDDPADAPQAAEDAPDAGEGRDPAAKARSEARNLRGRLKVAEAERDTLTTQLDAMRRAEAIRLASGDQKLSDGSDLFLAGVELGDLLADDGTVDPGKIDAAVDRVLADRPHWRGGRRMPRPDPNQRRTPDSHGTAGASWQDALRHI